MDRENLKLLAGMWWNWVLANRALALAFVLGLIVGGCVF